MENLPAKRPRITYNNATRAHDRALCYDLRLAGHSIRAIARLTGIPHSTVHELIEEQAGLIVQPRREAVRTMELDRLDQLLLALEPGIHNGDPKAIATALKISERRAKLEGIDAPVQIDAQVTETTQADLELQELINEARARNAQAQEKLAAP